VEVWDDGAAVSTALTGILAAAAGEVAGNEEETASRARITVAAVRSVLVLFVGWGLFCLGKTAEKNMSSSQSHMSEKISIRT
jgi:hypothetical protein